jgi:hypothetical protein
MRENLTNVGKKETRQMNRLLTKSVQEGIDRMGGKEVEARMVRKQHRLRGSRTK